jgi:phosphoribosylformylglycinamidine synthase
MVRTNTLTEMGGDAAVIRIKGTEKAIAMKTDCNPRYVYLNPYRGAQIAVAESARNVVCTGARPLAITNCLNFGNPYKPEIFWQFKEAVRGIGDACREFDTPVTGGNVSFYNESPERAVYPTPVIGMLGYLERSNDKMDAGFSSGGDCILVLGAPKGNIGGSEYLKLTTGLVAGDAPELDLGAEKRLQELCLRLIQMRLIHSAHDVSEGGIAVTIAESCIMGPSKPIGATISLPLAMRPDFELFGEDQSRIVVSASPDSVHKLKDEAGKLGVPVYEIGTVGGYILDINGMIRIDLKELEELYSESLANWIGKS